MAQPSQTLRTPRSRPRAANPVRDLVAAKQRAAELARYRRRSEQLTADLPSLIQNQVGEHMEKLQNKLLTDFRQMGRRAIEDSTEVLNGQLSERIQTLEQVSARQTTTLGNLRDSSKRAEQKVGSAVDSIEKSLAGAVPGGFELEPAQKGERSTPGYAHPQFQLECPPGAGAKTRPTNANDTEGADGVCPNCTSTKIRRANRHGVFEEFLRLFFIAPFRCRACRLKFYKF